VGVELAQPAYIGGGLANTNTDTNTALTETQPDSGLGQLVDLLGGEVIEEAES
jgi:hypothetical protein